MIFYPSLSYAGSSFSLSPSALTWVAVDLSLALLVIVVLIIACFTWKSYSRKRIKEQKVSSQHALCTLDLWKHTHNIISPSGMEMETCVLIREWSMHLFTAYQCAIYSHYQRFNRNQSSMIKFKKQSRQQNKPQSLSLHSIHGSTMVGQAACLC